MQSGREDSLPHKLLELLNGNASYSENYHEKYYYPKVVHDRVLARKTGDISHLDSKSERSKHPKIKGVEEGALATDLSPSPTLGCSASGWFLDPSEHGELTSPPRPAIPADLPHDCNTGNSDNSVSRRILPHMNKTDPGNVKDIGEGRPLPTMDNEDDWRALQCVGISSESVTSEDSVFSEDYTAMTDAAHVETEGVSLCDIEQGKRRMPAEGSEEVDSSFSSPFSSTSTLGADGKEDGGSVKDAEKDKVVANDAGYTTSMSRRGRNDIRISLEHTEIGVDLEVGGSSPPRPDMEQGPIWPGCDPEGTEKSFREGTAMKSSDSSSFYEDREFDYLKTEPVRRSTSLKTYKTPPGTPSRKKAVRFADALGLDLESVRHILNLEEPPEVPKSAMKDLRVGIEEDHKTSGVKYLSALFSQPGIDPGFLARVAEGKVVLENLVVNDKDMTISGTIRVANVSYHKHVIVRCSTNGWVSSDDVTASYVQNSNDSVTDRFSFTLNVPKYFAVGQRLELALMYNAGGRNYWDNNYGDNYAIECYAKAVPVSESDNTWMHFL